MYLSTGYSQQNTKQHIHYTPTMLVAIASICVNVTQYTGTGAGMADSYMHLTMQNHAKYAARHGYTYSITTEPSKHIKRHEHRDVRWDKVYRVQELLDHYDWVFWTDCDALFMNLERPLSFPTHNQHIVMAGDMNYGFNAGQFLIDNSVWSRAFLSDVLSPSNRRCGVGKDNPAFNWALFKNCNIAKRGASTVTACLENLNLSNTLQVADCGDIITYHPHYQSNTFRMHFPGDQHRKLSLIKHYLQYTNKPHRRPS